MRNIKITIEYDGSRYQGWTRLGKDESNNTISAKIIDVLGKMTGEKNIELNCGCRTEAVLLLQTILHTDQMLFP